MKLQRKFFSLVLLVSFVTETALGQKNEDNLIVVTVSDITNLYERVRQAITYTDFIIREDSKRDTLITYSERIDWTTIFVIAKVVVSGNRVEITGAYGLGPQDFWGYPGWPKSYIRIGYFKGSEAWKVIRRIALKLDGKIEYSKIR